MKVVLDTNVLVAALRSRQGASFALVSMIPSQLFTPAFSLPLYLECVAVLHRPIVRPAGMTDDEIKDFIDHILINSETKDIHFLWRQSLPDPKDDMVLELAVAAQAEYIITFNIRDFANIELLGVDAVTPAEFLEKLRKL